MFGYVRPSPERLTEEEQQRFNAVYCGLCHTLHRRYGWMTRMILNYDLAFLALLLEESETCSACPRRCMVHPIKARPCADASAALDTAADYSVILTWWKLKDSRQDERGAKRWSAGILSMLLSGAYRKAKRAQPEFAGPAGAGHLWGGQLPVPMPAAEGLR